MSIRGPDPDKNAYRFAINREISRWRTDLRGRWVEAMDEQSAQEIDAEFEHCSKPETLSDATLAKDIADFIKRHLDSLEHALKTREQLRANQARWSRVRATRRPGREELAVRALADIAEHAGQGLDVARLPNAAELEAKLAEPVEPVRSRTDPDLLHTNFPELSVKVPARLPDNLEEYTDEEREEAQERLDHIQRLAGIYQRKLDARSPEEVQAADEAAAVAAATNSEAKPYAAQWSDAPISRPGQEPPSVIANRQELAQALCKLYGMTGIEIDHASMTDTHVRVRLKGQESFAEIELPEPFRKKDVP